MKILIILQKIFLFVDKQLSLPFLCLIKIYQKTLSLDHSFFSRIFGIRVCLHNPSCSEYSRIAYKRFGFFRGSILTLLRILRCHPFNKNFIDPVPDNFIQFFKKTSK